MLSDRDKDGLLNEEEFMICMWLVNQAVAGKPLPYALPPQLQLKPEQHAPASAPPPQPQPQHFTQVPSNPSFSNLNSSGNQYNFANNSSATTTSNPTTYNYNPDEQNPSNYF